MHAMVLEAPRLMLRQTEIPLPELGVHDILLKVKACGVTRTDLHVLEGELSEAGLPHISDVPRFAIQFCGGERSVRSIANLTRLDGEECFKIATRAGIRTEIASFALEDANTALNQFRDGSIHGAAVLTMEYE